MAKRIQAISGSDCGCGDTQDATSLVANQASWVKGAVALLVLGGLAWWVSRKG